MDKERSRVELAAALLQYDAEDGDARAAFSSAILKPFRHVMEESYFSTVENYASTTRSFDDGDERNVERTFERDRQATELGEGNDLGEDDEERLVDEWGLKEHLSQLGGSSMGNGSHGSVGVGSNSEHCNQRRASTASSHIETVDSEGEIQPRARFKILERRRHSEASDEFLAVPTRSSVELPPIFGRRSSVAAISANGSISPIIQRRSSLAAELEPSSRPNTSSLSNYDEYGPPSPEPESLGAFDAPHLKTTSRFDPAAQALEKQQLQKDRPVFVNKTAGRSPLELTMPSPLANAAPALASYRRVRTEGPIEGEEEVVEVRPAGVLYGRSLLDVLSDRQATKKTRQRSYVPGNDGRKSMMELSSTPSGINPARKTIFGPDLLYARDLARLREVENAEAEARQEELDTEALAREKLKKKQEVRKGRKKLQKSAKVSLNEEADDQDLTAKFGQIELDRPLSVRIGNPKPFVNSLPVFEAEDDWFEAGSSTDSRNSLELDNQQIDPILDLGEVRDYRFDQPMEDGVDSEDDIPLGQSHPEGKKALDDDVPLALRHALIPTPRHHQAGEEEDEDDRPLGYIHPGAAQQQQFQHLQQQQQQQQQAFQQQQYYESQQQLQEYMMTDQPGGSVEQWRRGVS